jgi:D-alanine-D-alanine ligase
MKKTVCVIFGGRSSEYEVSLRSATSIISGIDREKYDTVLVGITKDGRWYHYVGDIESIKDGSWADKEESIESVSISQNYGEKALVLASGRRINIDLVFPAVHGENCEDGRLQGILESAGIPFVGPGSLASAICMDKSVTKAILSGIGIPQARATVVFDTDRENGFDAALRMASEIGYPVFVKPTSTGSSVGSSKANDSAELVASLENALRYGKKALVEEFISGKEVEIAVLGNDRLKVSVCGEIDPGFEFYDYDTKYKNDTASYHIPARISAECSDKLRAFAERIYRTLGCRGLSRVDFFVCKDEQIIFNEINTLPGFTSISMYPKLMTSDGTRFCDLVSALIELATL